MGGLVMNIPRKEFGTTARTPVFHNRASRSRVLQDRFDAFLIAVCTKVVNGCAVGLRFLQSVSQRSERMLVQRVTLFFCFPIFLTSNLAFQLCNSAFRRRMRFLGAEEFGVNAGNDAVKLGRLLMNFHLRFSVLKRLENIARLFQRGKSGGNR